jgi:uncharacterized membrane protein HdeD (DUF308 family)
MAKAWEAAHYVGVAMTTIEIPRPLHYLWHAMLIDGLITLALGALILGWPKISILAAATLLGIYLLVSGVAEIIFAFSLHASTPSRVLLFVTGALSVVLGILSLRHFGDSYAVLLLAIWIGVGFLFQGVAETATAISYRDLPGRGWHIFFGVVSVAAGLIVLAWPFGSIVMLAFFAGAWLLVIGVFEIVAALSTRHDLKKVESRVSEVFEPAPHRVG